jgi:hypothetical protein
VKPTDELAKIIIGMIDGVIAAVILIVLIIGIAALLQSCS